MITPTNSNTIMIIPITASILPIMYNALPAAPIRGMNIPKPMRIKPITSRATPVSKLIATMYFLQDISCMSS